MPEGTGVGSVYLDFVVRNTVAQQIRDITSQAAAQAQMGFEAAGKASGDAMQRAFSGGYNKTLEKARVKVRELESQFDSLGSKMDGMRQSAKGMFKGLKDPGRAADQFRDALDAPAACRNTRRGGAAARQQQPCSTERSKGRRHRDEGAGAGITLAPLTFSAPAHLSEQAAFSSNALTGAPGAEYATFEQDFMRLDGTQRMVPDSGGYLPGEWVWEDVVDASGAFPEGKTAAFGYIGRDANNIEETDNCAGSVTVTFGPGPLPGKNICVFPQGGRSLGTAAGIYAISSYGNV